MRVQREVFEPSKGSKLHSERAGGGVEREHAQLRRARVEDTVRHDGLALHLGALERVAGVVGPGDREGADVGRGDLLEG
jgi:hypothetical protein